MKKHRKKEKKCLTSSQICDIMAKPTRENEKIKKNEKSFQKTLDKRKRLWYNNKVGGKSHR